jgi:hypothetical protein
MDGRKNNGGKREGAGRPTKSEEQKLLEHLAPMKDEAHRVLFSAIRQQEQWAVKLWFEYFYGKPKQRVEVSTPDAKDLPEWMQ